MPKSDKNLKQYKELKPFICISGRLQNEYLERVQNEYLEKNKYKILYQKTIDFSKKYYLPIIAYIFMLFFTLKRIVNEIRKP